MILTNILIIFSLNFIESLLKLNQKTFEMDIIHPKKISRSNNGTIEKQYIISELKFEQQLILSI
jgi:hypothetical protein